ncbi:MAG: NADH-quinone oxidoreductase subunit N [Desulfobulbaceae bacterium]|nr:MAG: NADH-quinone oxidoreductase subunit N [Desulfobulbaceae bacterium]
MLLFLPELIILISALILFLVSLGTPSEKTLRNIVLCLTGLLLLVTLTCINNKGTLFFAAYQIDLYSQLFKLLIAAATFIVIVFSGNTPGIGQRIRAEYYMFLFTGLLGLMMLVSSVELLAIFISLELSSFALYIMVPMRQSSGAHDYHLESGIKYLLFGVMATGFMLFGMSYLFGLTGSTYLKDIIPSISYLYNQPAAVTGIIMVMAGFFYKLGLFPFHFWVPDIYEGAANETTSFVAAIPKLAAVALLIRLLAMVSVDGQILVNLLLLCSICSMFYGNLSALAQKDVKRILGYSGISHAGFILFGLLTFNLEGYSNALYYTIGYAAMTLTCFLTICAATPNGNNLKLEDLKGLHGRSPLLALTFALGLFSLAGIPPFVGFTGKLMILINAFKQGYVVPVILAALNTAIAIYYYLSMVRLAYCSDDSKESVMVSDGWSNKSLALLLVLFIITMGIFPTWFLDMAATVIGATV